MNSKKLAKIFFLAVAILISGLCPLSYADSLGPNNPGTVVDDDSYGTLTWGQPTYANSSNGCDAHAVTGGTTAYSHYLKATNFGFDIPTGATINGILVEIEKSKMDNEYGVYDTYVYIVKADGTFGSTDKHQTGDWPLTDTYYSYGSSSDDWGETSYWTESTIEDIDFGVALSVRCNGMEQCFIAGTQVLTPSGLKNIEDLAIGDEVISFNQDRQTSISKIVNANEIVDQRTLIEVETIDGEKVTATDDQIFFTPQGLVSASELKVGDKVFMYNNNQTIEQEIKSLQTTNEQTTAYDFTLDKDHLFSANNFIVHNACAEPPIGNGTALVDHIRITVYYTPVSPVSNTINNATINNAVF